MNEQLLLNIIEEQKKELAIESSLESVRTVALSMSVPDDMLHVCQTIAQQLELLKVKEIRNVQTAIFYYEKGTYMNYQYYAKHNETIVTETCYTDHEIPTAFAEQMRKGNGEFFISQLNGEEVKEWIAYQKTTNVFIDDYLYTASSLNYYWYSLGDVALGISTYAPLAEEETNLFRRFLKVFELSYRRYLDIEKAEAQAKEAKIELSLERVRAKTMAMQKSDELRDIVTIIFRELRGLDFPINEGAVIMVIFSENSRDHSQWIADPDQSYLTPFKVPYTEHPMVCDIVHAKEAGTDYFSKIYSKEEKNIFFNYFFEETDYKIIPEIVKKTLLESETYAYSIALVKNSGILIPNYKGKMLSDKESEILKRFSKVFEQAYIRFLDLQKAEAQAREAQIQLALERVRARTMAMQKSDELSETAVLLFHQLMSLGLDLRGCGFNIWEKDEKICTAWMSGPDGTLSPPFNIPLTEDPFFIRYYESRQKGDDFWVYETSKEELAARYEYFHTLPDLGEMLAKEKKEKAVIELPPFVVDHFVNFSNGNLVFITNQHHPEAHDIFKRFGKVFEQTYTRFLDLQKAEAQARESQIQLALERVRARTMAMQKSDELPEAANLLFQQVQSLGMPAWSAGYCTVDDDKQAITLWMSSAGIIQKPFRAPVTEDPSFIHFYNAWEKGEKFYVEEIGGDAIVSHYQYMLQLPVVGEMLKQFIADGGSLPTFQIFHLAFFSKGFLLFITYEPVPEAHDVFKRFAKVFEQTYTRFLDLQKAEAQARESQIEVSLERVRSKTMAMHNSNDLGDAAGALFTELNKLGIKPLRTGFVLLTKDSRRAKLYPAASFDNQNTVLLTGEFDFTGHPVFEKQYESWLNKENYFPVLENEEQLKSYYKVLKDNLSILYENVRTDKKQFGSFLPFSEGFLFTWSDQPYSESEINILIRFKSILDLTIRRFLDIQKAEAQAREAKIEAALERTRTQSMIMQHSSELDDTLRVFHEQVLLLGIDSAFSFLWLPDEEKDRHLFWAAWAENNSTAFNSKAINYPLDRNEPATAQCLIDWKSNEPVYSYHVPPASVNDYFAVWHELIAGVEQLKPEYFSDGLYYVEAFMKYGCFGIIVKNALSGDEKKILGRFAIEFERTYTRFLDLQKAEEQAREAQIELSLERVRAKTMAMHNSQDVGETVAAMFDEVVKLGIHTIRCGIGIMQETKEMEIWTAKPDEHGKVDLIIGRMDMTIHPLLQGAYKGWKNKQEFYTYELAGDDLINYFNAINNYPGYPVKYDMTSLPSKIIHTEFFFTEGTLFAFTLEKLSAEAVKIFKRFAAVFGQTYRRYLDLKKAEAQVRQAQIETAMEKVRARALAMQKPEELIEVAQLLRKEMGLLGVEELETSSIYIHDEASGKTECWYAIKDNQHAEKKLVSDHMDMQLQETWVGRQMLAFYHSDEKQISIPMKGDNRKEWINYCAKQSKVLDGFYGENIPERTYHLNKFSGGYMGAASPGNISSESWELLQRATSVFSLAYTRFSDLQQAEAQAREATIEAALEKVRGKAMAMRTSSDVSATASMVFTELRKLGINPIRSGVGLLTKDSVKAQLFSATSSETGDSLSLIGWIILSGVPVLERLYQAWLEQEDYYPELTGEQLKIYYEHLLAGLSVKVPDWQSGQTQYGHFIFFSVGCLYAWSDRRYNEAEIKILKRFGTIIDLTFRRYMELQTSEANAKDAVKQSALDRVRADIASMRTVADLDRITPLIWNELTILGIPFIRCGVFIMDDSQQLIHTFLSTPDGKAIAAFHLPYDTQGNFAEMVSRWRNKQVYVDHWGEAEFTSMADTLVKQGAIATQQQYLNTLPEGGFYLHFLPFLQGMLYAGNLTKLSDDDLKLIQSVADAFSTAYARYEDFNKLELANRQIEKTLVDLKQAQSQLVQSEKMASLGELTAGIAHEIQNPLNFVNNFSDVNTELIEELKSEWSIVNGEKASGLIDELLNDIKANEEKINHHGKRADAIVKGMLQHSRTSTNQKEPTDINALADEYLRLSYHGLRAKDKSFNATMKTDFDESTGKINIIPQDIGRVFLNLYNNAFYAVNEKIKILAATDTKEKYEPVVTVSTKKVNGKVEIKVTDNGSGIPRNIVDKIFQPFFTTKPTGQGTGLGLSLSYDIIKAHSGEIKVETKENEGTAFIINLNS